MTSQIDIEKTYGVPTQNASPPEDRDTAGGPPEDSTGFDRYWQRLVEGAELRAHEQEERALIAEQGLADERERADRAERRAEALQDGLTSRASIDQAKGVIMGVFALSADPAFEVLVWVSQWANIKVKTIADRFLLEVHELDLGRQPREKLTRALAALAGDASIPMVRG